MTLVRLPFATFARRSRLRMSPCARRFAIRAVLHIGLPARHGLHVVRIGQDYLEAPFKEVEDPVHACGLHRHVCARRVRLPRDPR